MKKELILSFITAIIFYFVVKPKQSILIFNLGGIII